MSTSKYEVNLTLYITQPPSTIFRSPHPTPNIKTFGTSFKDEQPALYKNQLQSTFYIFKCPCFN